MSDLSCEACADLLGDHAEGLLVGAVRDAFEAHVATCLRCRALLRDYEAIPDLVRRETDAHMPYDVELRLRRLVAATHRRRRSAPE
jgi:anti-sigma factor RsiW